jgi:hypothetical protein
MDNQNTNKQAMELNRLELETLQNKVKELEEAAHIANPRAF